MGIFVLVPLILVVTFIMGLLFNRIGLPAVVGHILAVILIGVPFLTFLPYVLNLHGLSSDLVSGV
ncbi:MAG: hypothetical protein NWE84_01045 [Candidatus Bathyarchaeota archaeon]|nr:hypothetical protein [Candidatus Bathyarchaeota archaeon]